MTRRSYYLQGAGASTENLHSPLSELPATILSHDVSEADCHSGVPSGSTTHALHAVVRRLAKMDLLGKEQVESYLRHVARRNYKPSTLYGILTALELFLGVVKDAGKTRLADITRDDVEAFIEHEQDRGVKITSVRTRLVLVQTFLGYGIDGGFISPSVFGRRIRLQLPACLPRAMEPDDVQRLLAVVDLTRDRAMMLVLLRTGMRIGELLATKMTEVHLRERRIEIYEGEKNRLGRVVYLSDDAVSAVKAWLNARDSRSGYLIHGRRSMRLCYSAARSRFEKYLMTAGLTHKGYTLHSLRHTFASELLNAGMRLECLQVLLGHQSIQETRRYARLTDTTREEEYFRAMSIIERGEINGHYRRDHELAAFPETEELCT